MSRSPKEITIPKQITLPGSLLASKLLHDRQKVYVLIAGVAQQNPDGWCYLSLKDIATLIGIYPKMAVVYRTQLLREGHLERIGVPVNGNTLLETADPDVVRVTVTREKGMGYRPTVR